MTGKFKVKIWDDTDTAVMKSVGESAEDVGKAVQQWLKKKMR